MRKELIEKIAIPAGIETEISGDELKIKKDGKEISRKFSDFVLKKEGNELVMSIKIATKNEKKMLKTFAAHLRNMFMGLENKFVYKLQICAVHFPITATIDKEKKILSVKNFLGEVKPRIAKLIDGVEVKVDKEMITVESHDREKAGQTAANIEGSTRISNRDRRTFQDGIFITKKPEY